MRKFVDWIRQLFASMEIFTVGRWAFYGVAIGVPAAFVGMAFNWIMDGIQWLSMERIAGFVPPLPGGEAGAGHAGDIATYAPFVLIALPALGGLLCGWIVYKFAPEAEGHGTDHVIDSYHHKRGMIRARVPLVKVIASSITIGTGGSAGREGPIAQVGAGIGSFLAQKLKLSDGERRILLLCGAGAGIGAIFKAPLGGALFAAEVLYRDPEFEFEALIPCFISAIVAYSCYCPLSGAGWGPIFTIPELVFRHPSQLLLFGVLALVVVLMGRLYIETFGLFHRGFFSRLKMKKWMRPAFGGLLLGLLSFVFWVVILLISDSQKAGEYVGAVLGMGYGYVQWVLDGKYTVEGQIWFGVTVMMLLALAKILATSLTITSGGSGGVFAPSLVIGGLTGGAIGLACHSMFGNLVSAEEVGAFVLLGMAGLFTGVAKVPLASMIMVSEMTSGYSLLAPLMLVVAVSYVLSPRKISIYESQMDGRIDSPAHTGDFITDVLEDIQVKDVLRPQSVETVREDTLLSAILQQATQANYSSFQVVSESGKLTGLISLQDIRSAFLDPHLGELIIAGDIAVARGPVFADESLNVALRKLVSANCEELPVVDDEEDGKILGMLSRRDLIVAYNRQMQERLKLKNS